MTNYPEGRVFRALFRLDSQFANIYGKKPLIAASSGFKIRGDAGYVTVRVCKPGRSNNGSACLTISPFSRRLVK